MTALDAPKIIPVEHPNAILGIGRPLVVESAAAISEAISQTAPKGVTLEFWKTPCVVYVEPSELSATALHNHLRTSLGTQKAIVDQVLATYADENILDEASIEQPVPTPISHMLFAYRRGHKLLIGAALDRNHSSASQLNEESDAIRHELDIDPKLNMILTLGLLSYGGSVNPTELQHQVRHTIDQVILGRVGPLAIDPRPQ